MSENRRQSSTQGDKSVMCRPDQFVTGYPDSYRTYSMPKSYVTYHKPRAVSDEQRELDSDRRIGLIESIRQGLGKPNIIYVKNFVGSSPE